MAKDRAANQIFVGYLWKTYKSHWEQALIELYKRSPLYFVAIGRKRGQLARECPLLRRNSRLDSGAAAVSAP